MMGERTPLDDAPSADADTAWFVQAFSRLNRSRGGGMGPGPVALSEMCAYWREVGAIGPLDEFIDVIQALDGMWLERQAAKAAAQRPP